jgi:hypothetical protein
VSERTIIRLEKQRLLTPIRIGRAVRHEPAEVKALAAKLRDRAKS